MKTTPKTLSISTIIIIIIISLGCGNNISSVSNDPKIQVTNATF